MCFYYTEEQFMLLAHLLVVDYSYVLSKAKPNVDILVIDQIVLVSLVYGLEFQKYQTLIGGPNKRPLMLD